MTKSRGYIAVGLWVLATTLMLYGSDQFHRDRGVDGMAWGIFMAVAALGFTTWVLSERRDRLRDASVDHIIEVVDALHRSGSSPRSLR